MTELPFYDPIEYWPEENQIELRYKRNPFVPTGSVPVPGRTLFIPEDAEYVYQPPLTGYSTGIMNAVEVAEAADYIVTTWNIDVDDDHTMQDFVGKWKSIGP